MSREMKHSGIPWIGEIPKDWKELRFKYAGIMQKGKLPVETNVDGIGEPIIGASEMLGKPFRQYSTDSDVPKCKHSDIIILWDGANAGIVANKLCGIVSSTAVCYSCTDCKCDSSYVFYLFKGVERYFRDKVFGTTIPHMNSSYIDDVPLLLPPLSEQQKIASFLDEKCSEIDEMVVLQEKIIEELKAYKQSVITEAVTKGLNPDAPMKDSEIMFVDKIPSHWKETKTLRLLSMPITDGPHETPECLDDGIPFISADAVSDGYINFNNKWGYISKEYYEECCKKYIPQRQDIYMIKSGASTGRTAIVETDEVFTIWSPLAVFRANKEVILPHFLLYVLRSDSYQKQVESKWSFGTQQNIGMRTLEKLIISYPSVSEQQAIADYLEEKCADIDNLIQIKQSKIESLKEYKKSIIYEYVTGKKEVE